MSKHYSAQSPGKNADLCKKYRFSATHRGMKWPGVTNGRFRNALYMFWSPKIDDGVCTCQASEIYLVCPKVNSRKVCILVRVCLWCSFGFLQGFMAKPGPKILIANPRCLCSLANAKIGAELLQNERSANFDFAAATCGQK